MFLLQKFREYKQNRRERSKRKITERELLHLNHKIVSTKPLSQICLVINLVNYSMIFVLFIERKITLSLFSFSILLSCIFIHLTFMFCLLLYHQMVFDDRVSFGPERYEWKLLLSSWMLFLELVATPENYS